jgi:hypothetical protein
MKNENESLRDVACRPNEGAAKKFSPNWDVQLNKSRRSEGWRLCLSLMPVTSSGACQRRPRLTRGASVPRDCEEVFRAP